MSKVKFEMEKNKFHEILYALLGFIISIPIMIIGHMTIFVDVVVGAFIVTIWFAILSMWYFSMSNIYMTKRLEKE